MNYENPDNPNEATPDDDEAAAAFLAAYGDDGDGDGYPGAGDGSAGAGDGAGAGEGGAGDGDGQGAGDGGEGGAGAADNGAGDGAGNPGGEGAGGAGDGAGGAADGAGADAGIDTAGNGGQVAELSEDVLASLPENIRQQLASLKEVEQRNQQLTEALATSHRQYESMAGRVAPLQRQVEVYQRQQQRPAEVPAAQTAEAAPGTATKKAQAEIDEAIAYYDSDEFKDFAKTWPEEAELQKKQGMRALNVAKATAERLDAMEARFAPAIESMQVSEQKNAKRAEMEELRKAHPDFDEVNNSDAFWDWYGQQRDMLNFKDEAHERAQLNSGAYVSKLLTNFKASRPAAPAPAGQPSGQAAPAANAGGAARLALSARPAVAGAAPMPRPTSGVDDAADFLAGYNSED